MIIVIGADQTDQVAHLDQVDDFTDFHIETKDAPGGCQAGLAAIGRVDGEHVYVDRDRVLELAGGRASDRGWREGFDGMVRYAASKGWTDEKGAVRAHIVSK